MYVPMELSRVIISEYSGEQYIFLREIDGERTFPIVIGMHEALAIDRRLKGQETPRPMTHELLAGVIDALGGRLEKIHIDDLRTLEPDDTRQTFIATLFIRQDGGLREVDSRPSDAIALGVGFDTPIYVAESVLENVLDDSPEHRLKLLKQHEKALREKIEALQARLGDEEFTRQAPEEVLENAREHLQRLRTEHEAVRRVLEMLE